MPDKVQTVYASIGSNGKLKEIYTTPVSGCKPIRIHYHTPNKKGMGRNKGNALERETAKAFSKWIYGVQNVLKRTPLSGGWASGKAGDIILDHEKARNREKYPEMPMYVECRSYKDILGHGFINWLFTGKPKTITGWIKEVESKADGRLPFLVIKGNNTKPYILLLRRWLTKRTRPKGGYHPLKLYCWNSAKGYLVPLSWLDRLGDGRELFRDWVKDGGPANIRKLGKSYK